MSYARLFLWAVFCFLSVSCAGPPSGYLARINFHGIGVAQVGKVMEVAASELPENLADGPEFRITEAATGKEVPYQWEYRGHDKPLNLLVQVDMPAEGEVELHVVKGTPQTFESRTFARYVPERLDDFAWENDKIAFRIYGKALEGTPGDAHGIDVWVKRTDALVIDKWYESGDYHTDHGEGLDYYSVGLTLGAGDIAPYVNDSLWFPKHYRGHEVLDNGPLRSTFRLNYEEWNAGGIPVTASKLISLDAGSQLNRVEVRFDAAEEVSFPAAVGIVQRKQPGKHLMDKEAGLLAYWEPTHASHGTTGIGAFIDAPVRDVRIADGHILGIVEVKTGEPLVYYVGAAWDRAGEITTAEDWFNYLHTRMISNLK